MSEDQSFIVPGDFVSRAGIKLPFKVDCDYLSDSTIEAIAQIVASRYTFNTVAPIFSGGNRLARALVKYETSDRIKAGYTYLIVDDVTTTGSSFIEKRDYILSTTCSSNPNILGFTIFSRGSLPYWVTTLFQVNPIFS